VVVGAGFREQRARTRHRYVLPLLAIAGVAGFALFLTGLQRMASDRFGLLLVLAATALVAVLLGLRNPVLACTYLLAATFFRLAIPTDTFPVDPFLPAFVGVVVAVWVWARPRGSGLPGLHVTEAVIALYIGWNIGSMLAPHQYAAGAPQDVGFSVLRFVLIGTMMPLIMFLVGKTVFRDELAIRRLTWMLLIGGAYSSMVSIMQFHGPKGLVWPRYIIDEPNWPGRAVGVFNQPVVNGLVLIVGFLVSVLIASHREEVLWLRGVSVVVAGASAYAIFLTHTRAVWLSFALVVLIGAVTAKGFRGPFVVTALVMAVTVVADWSALTSTDRSAGGVASKSELQDRLNTIATSIWAVEVKPLQGWGIGRFPAVNTYHHQQWSPETPWQRGYGIPSHLDILGIFAELGLVGIVLWLTILALIITQVLRATRRLPVHGLCNRPFALTALMSVVALIATGLTVDLRFFDFPNIVVMMLAGAAIGRAARVDELGFAPGRGRSSGRVPPTFTPVP
jgi:O-antigen ligase